MGWLILRPFAFEAGLQAASDTGESSSDNITNDTSPTWDVSGPMISGDVLESEIFNDPDWFLLASHTVTLGEQAAQTAAITAPQPPSGSQTHRFRIVRGAFSSPWSEDVVEFDYAAPVLSNPVGVAVGTETANLTVDSDTATGTVYVVVTNSATITAAQIKAGHDHNDAPAFYANTIPAALLEPTPQFADNLDQGTRWVHWVHTDLAGNDSAVATSPSWEQGAVVVPPAQEATWDSDDEEPNPTFGLVNPVGDPLAVNDVINIEVYTDVTLTTLFISAENTLDGAEVTAEAITQFLNLPNDDYWVQFRRKHQGGAYGVFGAAITKTIDVPLPAILTNATTTSTGPSTFDISVTTDTGDGTLYLVISTSATPPTVTQMAAGQDHTGAAAFFAGNQAVVSTGSKLFNTAAAVFVSGTAYFAHFAQINAALDWSTVLTSTGFGIGITQSFSSVVWATGPTQANPDFDLEAPDNDPTVLGDTINGEIYNDAGLTSLVASFEHTVIATDIGLGWASETLSLPDNTYYARFRRKHFAGSYSSWLAASPQIIGAGAVDNVPNPFTFTDVTNATASTEYISNLITLGGMDIGASCSVSFSGSAHTWSKDGAGYTTGSTTGINGTNFRVKLTTGGLSGGVMSVVMNAGGAQDTFTVTNGDVDAPTISTLTPLDGATSVAVNANLVATFSEPIQWHTTVVMSIRRTSDDVVIHSFTQADIGGAIAISGSTMTINPPGDLTNNVGYYVLIGGTSIKDLAGNFFAGIAAKTTWNFTTVAAATGDLRISATGEQRISATGDRRVSA